MKDDGPYSADEIEQELTFIGLIAMMDPLRPEVAKAVAECRTAGIKVTMITGDYGITAKAIAKDAGISCATIITGEELGRMNDKELREALKKDVLFARAAPQDKLRVVTALQANGEVVAVTGDGVNDAPALKKADIGIAMGLRGSDVAKESADIILTDDNFASIVDAVREGRTVFANIKKFVTYIFASNVPGAHPVHRLCAFQHPASPHHNADPCHRPRHRHHACHRPRGRASGSWHHERTPKGQKANGSSTGRPFRGLICSWG